MRLLGRFLAIFYFRQRFFPRANTKAFQVYGIYNYALKLIDGKQPPYRPIYNLELVELENLKMYVKFNLANGFIRLLKSSIDALNSFV